MSWTDERVATLKNMWKDGASAADIAKTLGKGVTRNAVIGKAHRMGLSGRPSPIKKSDEIKKSSAKAAKGTKTAAKKSEPKKAVIKKVVTKVNDLEPKVKSTAKKKAEAETKPVKTKVKKTHAEKEAALEAIKLEAEQRPVDGGVALIDLSERMCKWPFGDPQEDDFTFCGKEIYAGKPYCSSHVIMAYQSSSRSRAVMRDIEDDAEDIDVDDIEDEVDEVDEDKVGAVD
jgi:GcrA cell cycle regulator